MNIGSFKQQENGDYIGQIDTFGYTAASVTIEAITTKGSGPDYIVHTPTGELGAAWKKVSEKGNNYLSVSFKGPLVQGPIYAALVATNEKGTFALVWSEPRENKQ